MYLLRRKSDGKFYKNPDYSAYCRSAYGQGGHEVLWTDSASECKPFQSESGIKNSRGVSYPLPEHVKHRNNQDWRNWWSRANNKIRAKWNAEKFRELYEIVEVSIQFKPKAKNK